MIKSLLTKLKDNRDKAIKGEINCIPFVNLPKLRRKLPGIERGKYYLISGGTKSSKTQIMNYLFLYNSVMYAYKHPEKINLKIFYFPLEETPENIILRFMAYLLYIDSKGEIRYSPVQLRSTDNEFPIPEDILEKINSPRFIKILNFFCEHVEFCEEKSPTGIRKKLWDFAKEDGQIITEKISWIDKCDVEHTVDKQVGYEPHLPNRYVMTIIDHLSILKLERGMSLKENMDTLSSTLLELRNRFNFIPVVVQQQNNDSLSLDASTKNKIRPTFTGLKDTKNSGQDCNVMLGITNPNSFEKANYAGYDITAFQGYIRFLEIVLNRDGECNDLFPLYFDGAVNYYAELDAPNGPTTTSYKDKALCILKGVKTTTNIILLTISKLFKNDSITYGKKKS